MSPMDSEGYITHRKSAGKILAWSCNMLHHDYFGRQEENMLLFSHII